MALTVARKYIAFGKWKTGKEENVLENRFSTFLNAVVLSLF